MRKRNAFTLVELLVVIGIIALLISILLPSLTRARAAANVVDCAARLRQVGQGMQLYASQFNGLLPWGMLYHDAGSLQSTPNPYPAEPWWKWHYTISNMLGTDNMRSSTDWFRANSMVFEDKDTIEGRPWEWRTDYIANPRVFQSNWAPPGDESRVCDPYPPARTRSQMTQRKIASIRNGAEVMAVWDAPQWAGYGNSSIERADHVHGWQFYWGTYLVTPVLPENSWANSYYDQPLRPGAGGGDGAVLQKQWNKDFAGAPWAPENASEGYASAFRFRHMNNTTLNALYVDGHVDSKKVGEVKVRDVCTSPY